MPWGCGSVGRAMRSQRIGQGFESPHLHHKKTGKCNLPAFLFCCTPNVEGVRTKASKKWWTPTIFSDDRSIEQDIHIYKHFCLAKCKNESPHLHHKTDFVSVFSFEGICTTLLCATLLQNPLQARADARFHKQVCSTCYSVVPLLTNPLISTIKRQASAICLPFYFAAHENSRH